MTKKMKIILIILTLFFQISIKVNAEIVRTSVNIPFNTLDLMKIPNTQNMTDSLLTMGNYIIYIDLWKEFNLQKDDGSLITLNSTLDVGKKLNPKINSTAGNHNILSTGFGDTVLSWGAGNINDTIYTHAGGCWGTCAWYDIYIKVFGFIEDDNNIKITSNNPSVVECVNNSCTSKSTGVAKINVVFNQKTQDYVTSGVIDSMYRKTPFFQVLVIAWNYYNIFLRGSAYYGTNSGYAKFIVGGRVGTKYDYGGGNMTSEEKTNLKNMTYSFPSITYTVTVPEVANTPQVSTCTGATGITKDSATVNWSYTDDDNDPQTQYQVQLSTKSFIDPTFSTSTDVVFSASDASADTSHTFTGLTPNTTYYTRIKTQNAVNGWSGYSNCNSSFTTSEDPDVPASTCSCNGTRDYTCTNPDGTVASIKTGSDQCAFTAYCSHTTTDDKVTFTFGPASNRIGSVKYEHSGNTPVTKTGPYDYSNSYTVDKVEDTQTFTVTLTDLGDDTTLLPTTCSVTNDSTPATCSNKPSSCPEGKELTWSCDATTDIWSSAETSNTCTPTTPKITIKKTPAVTLNKGGRCTLDWAVENRPATGMTCTLTGTGGTVSETLPNDASGTWISPALYQNTKYTISCTGGTQPVVPKSVICRVNPSVNEI